MILHDPDIRAEVETRLFVLNGCTHSCYNCFYNKKSGNDFSDFRKVIEYTQVLKDHLYHCETLFIFPIDYLDETNKEAVIENQDFLELVSMYNSIGIATTFLSNYDINEFKRLKNICPNIDIFVNLDYKKFEDITYFELIRNRINEVTELYGKDHAIINCAINLGAKLKERWIADINRFKELSTDKNIELNFTFLSNQSINDKKTVTMFENALTDLNILRSSVYENLCANETILNKITLAFMGNGDVYFSPMIPYDEALNLRYDKYKIETPNDIFNVIQACYQEEVPPDCEVCENISFCMGKGFISIRNTLHIDCYQTY